MLIFVPFVYSAKWSIAVVYIVYMQLCYVSSVTSDNMMGKG